MAPALRRAVRVAGASGGFSDRVCAIARLAQNEDVDVVSISMIYLCGIISALTLTPIDA